MFEFFEHTADLGLRVTADSVEELYIEAARGFFSLIVENLDDVRPEQDRSFTINGTDHSYLLFDWLNELLYVFDTTHLLLADFKVTLDESGLRAVARGEPWDPDRHHLTHEVKAITYHGLEVTRSDDTWRAEVIVDI